MAKLSVFSAVFAALIAIAAATTYTTTVVTEINPEQSCQAEIQRMRMSECMEYVGMGMGRPSYEPSFLRSEVANPKQQEEEHLEECCDEMRSVSSPCRGDAMRHMMKEMKKMPGMEGSTEEMQKMMSDKVRSLTQKCGLKRSPYMI